jgi:hypothetical protein
MPKSNNTPRHKYCWMVCCQEIILKMLLGIGVWFSALAIMCAVSVLFYACGMLSSVDVVGCEHGITYVTLPDTNLGVHNEHHGYLSTTSSICMMLVGLLVRRQSS